MRVSSGSCPSLPKVQFFGSPSRRLSGTEGLVKLARVGCLRLWEFVVSSFVLCASGMTRVDLGRALLRRGAGPDRRREV